MRKRKTLVMLLGVLVAYLVFAQLKDNDSDSYFEATLLQLHNQDIQTVVLHTPNQQPITFTKLDTSWIATQDHITTKALTSVIESLIQPIKQLQTTSIVAKNQKDWSDFNVEVEKGVRVQVFNQQQKLEDFIVGSTNQNKNTPQKVSYVRLEGEQEVYAVNNELGFLVRQPLSNYRDKQFLKLKSHTEIDSLVWYKKNELQVLQAKTIILDSFFYDASLKLNYVEGLQSLEGIHFANDFDDTRAEAFLEEKLAIYVHSLKQPVYINCYIDKKSQRPYVLQSSQFEDNYFESDELGLYDRVFGVLKSKPYAIATDTTLISMAISNDYQTRN